MEELLRLLAGLGDAGGSTAKCCQQPLDLQGIQLLRAQVQALMQVPWVTGLVHECLPLLHIHPDGTLALSSASGSSAAALSPRQQQALSVALALACGTSHTPERCTDGTAVANPNPLDGGDASAAGDSSSSSSSLVGAARAALLGGWLPQLLQCTAAVPLPTAQVQAGRGAVSQGSDGALSGGSGGALPRGTVLDGHWAAELCDAAVNAALQHRQHLQHLLQRCCTQLHASAATVVPAGASADGSVLQGHGEGWVSLGTGASIRVLQRLAEAELHACNVQQQQQQPQHLQQLQWQGAPQHQGQAKGEAGQEASMQLPAHPLGDGDLAAALMAAVAAMGASDAQLAHTVESALIPNLLECCAARACASGLQAASSSATIGAGTRVDAGKGRLAPTATAMLWYTDMVERVVSSLAGACSAASTSLISASGVAGAARAGAAATEPLADTAVPNTTTPSAADGMAASAVTRHMRQRGCSEVLRVLCRLQAHVEHMCQQASLQRGGGQQQGGQRDLAERLQHTSNSVHQLMRVGLTHRDPQARARSQHLLTALLDAGCAPQVPGFDSAQWQAYLAVYRCQEQHVLHLVLPVWETHMPIVWQALGAAHIPTSTNAGADGAAGAADTLSSASAGAGAGAGGCGSALQWVSVLLRRSCFHCNVAVRRLGLWGLLGVPRATLHTLLQRDGHAELLQLLMELLPAFDHDRLLPSAEEEAAVGTISSDSSSSSTGSSIKSASSAPPAPPSLATAAAAAAAAAAPSVDDADQFPAGSSAPPHLLRAGPGQAGLLRQGVVRLLLLMLQHTGQAGGWDTVLCPYLAAVEGAVQRPSAMLLLTRSAADAAATAAAAAAASGSSSGPVAAPAASQVSPAAHVHRQLCNGRAVLRSVLKLLHHAATLNPLVCRRALQVCCLRLAATCLQHSGVAQSAGTGAGPEATAEAAAGVQTDAKEQPAGLSLLAPVLPADGRCTALPDQEHWQVVQALAPSHFLQWAAGELYGSGMDAPADLARRLMQELGEGSGGGAGVRRQLHALALLLPDLPRQARQQVLTVLQQEDALCTPASATRAFGAHTVEGGIAGQQHAASAGSTANGEQSPCQAGSAGSPAPVPLPTGAAVFAACLVDVLALFGSQPGANKLNIEAASSHQASAALQGQGSAQQKPAELGGGLGLGWRVEVAVALQNVVTRLLMAHASYAQRSLCADGSQHWDGAWEHAAEALAAGLLAACGGTVAQYSGGTSVTEVSGAQPEAPLLLGVVLRAHLECPGALLQAWYAAKLLRRGEAGAEAGAGAGAATRGTLALPAQLALLSVARVLCLLCLSASSQAVPSAAQGNARLVQAMDWAEGMLRVVTAWEAGELAPAAVPSSSHPAPSPMLLDRGQLLDRFLSARVAVRKLLVQALAMQHSRGTEAAASGPHIGLSRGAAGAGAREGPGVQVAAAGLCSAVLCEAVVLHCLDDLEWAADEELEEVTDTLLAAAPWQHLPATPPSQGGSSLGTGEAGFALTDQVNAGVGAEAVADTGAAGSTADAAAGEGLSEAMQRLLRQLPSLLRGVGLRITARLALSLCRLCLAPQLFHQPQLRPQLQSLLPLLLGGQLGPRMSLACACYLCSDACTAPGDPHAHLLLSYPRAIAHFLSLGAFVDDPVAAVASSPLAGVSAAAATAGGAKGAKAAKGRGPGGSRAGAGDREVEPAALLPSRVAFCAFLERLMDRQQQEQQQRQHSRQAEDEPQAQGTGAAQGPALSPEQQLLDGMAAVLLQLVQGAAPPYAWLTSREGSKASPANAVKVAAWQALCLLSRGLSEGAAEQAAREGWQCLLQSSQHPNLRPFVQLFLVQLLSRQAQLVKALLMPALQDYAQPSYQVSVSTVVVALLVLLTSLPKPGGGSGSAGTSEAYLDLMQALVPWALHHRHAVRVPVQALLHAVLGRHLAALEAAAGPRAVALLSEMRQFLDHNPEMRKLLSRQMLVDLHTYSVERETSLQGLFGVRCEEALEDGETPSSGLTWHLHLRDRLPLDLLALVPLMLRSVNKASYARAVADRGAAQEGALADGNEGEGEDGDVEGGAGVDALEGGADREAEDVEEGAAAAAAAYQLRPQVQASLLDEGLNRAEALVAARSQQRGLVVVASLLDNLPNLAGLCRTCESMSVEALVLPDRCVVQSDAFKRQSVTSERWLHLLEVTPTDLATFLAERRAAGYTIMAVEQAANSVGLEAVAFPRECVLLLGNEQNGVPAPLLDFVDVCVEIPMLGITRSLNAHVSGAMAVWTYTMQHLPAR